MMHCVCAHQAMLNTTACTDLLALPAALPAQSPLQSPHHPACLACQSLTPPAAADRNRHRQVHTDSAYMLNKTKQQQPGSVCGCMS